MEDFYARTMPMAPESVPATTLRDDNPTSLMPSLYSFDFDANDIPSSSTTYGSASRRRDLHDVERPASRGSRDAQPRDVTSQTPTPQSAYAGEWPAVAQRVASSHEDMASSAFAAAHAHTDTYETPLPPEALGAQQLVDYVFLPPVPNRPYSQLSPPNTTHRPKPTEIGLPLPMASEPVQRQLGRRLVYFGRRLPPLWVVAEPRHRFVAIVFRPLLHRSDSALSSPPMQLQQPPPPVSTLTTSYGTVLGYSDANDKIIWHERSERFASAVPLSAIYTIHRAAALQCKHCGQVLLRPELREHMATHKKGSGVEYGVFTDDAQLGMACGDTGLLQNISRRRRLGQGAQGVVDLYDVIQPSEEAAAQAGPASMTYHYTSAQTSPEANLRQVVVKTMSFESPVKALEQYQQSVRFMTVMNHPHLVEYLAVQLMPDSHTVRLMMPYYSEGDVAAMIKDFRGDHIEESVICSVALQLSVALTFLHERNPPVIHGDIKVENIMFYNHREQVVLMDLDTSYELRSQHEVRASSGTAAYMAPETLNCNRLMPASDLWSLGVFIFVFAVLPDFPMIVNPNTGNYDLLNAASWATPEDLAALRDASRSAFSIAAAHRAVDAISNLTGNRGITLGECVFTNLRRKGYSTELAQLTVDLLSYDPMKRPMAADVEKRLTDIMTNCLLRD